jgi:hypothetical protein
MKHLFHALCAIVCLFECADLHPTAAAESAITLAGEWRLQLDRENAGVQQRWHERQLPQSVQLPGCLPAQGIGDDITLATPWMGDVKHREWYKNPLYAKYAEPGDIHFPFWLQPDKYYAGAAWYQRDVQIPQDWEGRRVALTLERPHWATRVWIDDQEIGSNDSLSTPHEYDLGALAQGKHRLTIRVDNSLVVDIGVNSHSITDHTQGNWNGIAGRLELAATDSVWIDDLQVFPDAAKKQLRVQVRIGNAGKQRATRLLAIEIDPADKSESFETASIKREVSVPPGGADIEIEAPLGDDVRLWDEFSPALHQLRARLHSSNRPQPEHERKVTFGIRDVSTTGTQFLINGRKTFFRGTLECAVFPATGYPPTDVESWKRIIRICKAHGLNMIRFHSWCPPEAAFQAANELGFYYQVEAASWANQSTTIGDGKPVDQWVRRETDRILQAYGNHPSFVLMTYGNEPGGPSQETYLAEWVNSCRKQDPRRLYSSAAGWPQIDENQFHVTPDPRVQEWGAGLKSRINGQPPETCTDYRDYIGERQAPMISHEIGQWCAYPNFDEIPKYAGYLKPKNFAIFRDSLNAHAMGDQARDFLMASGKLQTLCYKEDIEAALRTPGMGGFQLLGLNDFPGQGTALVGSLDPFWDSKGYVTPKEYRRFCNVTVPLARLAKRVFTTDETIEAKLDAAHFGAAPLDDAVVRWKLVDEHGQSVAAGELPPQTIPVDNGVELGRISVPLGGVPAPAKYRLAVGIADTPFENDWDVWAYPPQLRADQPTDVLVVAELNDDALAKLDEGGKVLLTAPPSRVKGDRFGKVGLGFSSVFWNTAWTDRQPPHTLGILCDPEHPLFAEFPTEFHSNWQWWYLINRSGAMILDELPADLRPLVQVIDDWVTNRRLGLAFEAKLGRGKLLVCSVDLEQELDADPVRRQFRHSLLKYMGSEKFAPQHAVTADQVRSLMSPASPMDRLGAIAVATDSAETENDGYQAIDGNPRTIWHTQWRAAGPAFPHSIQVQFKSPISIRGFTVLPRQDGVQNGLINDYAFYASDDGEHWGEPIARGSFTANKELKTVNLPKPVTGRFFRLVAASGFDALPYASIAEFAVIADAVDGALESRPAAPTPLKRAASAACSIEIVSESSACDSTASAR